MSDVSITREPTPIYGFGQRHSFYADAVNVSLRGDRDAEARLLAHEAFIDDQIKQDTKIGQRALRERMTVLRGANPQQTHREREIEARAITSSTMTGFTTPQYLLEEFAVYAGTHRAFVDQTTRFPLPDVGLQVYIPDFTAASSAGVQSTEGAFIGEVDPTSSYLTEPVRTIAGQVTVSMQALKRGSTQGFTFDQFVFAQLMQNYDQNVNNYVLGKVLSAAPSVPESAATFSLANFYQDVAAAREVLTDTAGTRVYPSHVFTTPDLYGYATRQLDGQNRPLITPQLAPGNPVWPTEENPDRWRSFSGTVLPGNLMWFLDETIQPQGANTLVIVSKPDTVVFMEGEQPTLRVFPDASGAPSLNALLQIYNYVCCIPRYPSATSYVTGVAYPTSLI